MGGGSPPPTRPPCRGLRRAAGRPSLSSVSGMRRHGRSGTGAEGSSFHQPAWGAAIGGRDGGRARVRACLDSVCLGACLPVLPLFFSRRQAGRCDDSDARICSPARPPSRGRTPDPEHDSASTSAAGHDGERTPSFLAALHFNPGILSHESRSAHCRRCQRALLPESCLVSLSPFPRAQRRQNQTPDPFFKLTPGITYHLSLPYLAPPLPLFPARYSRYGTAAPRRPP